jgi:hypothetical protein
MFCRTVAVRHLRRRSVWFMEMIKYANLALRFLLELCALAALSYWGFQIGKGNLAKVSLAVTFPLLAAIVWGVFAAPKAAVPVSGLLRLLLQLVIFGAAVVGLYGSRQTTLAVIFGLLVLGNLILMYAWKQ